MKMYKIISALAGLGVVAGIALAHVGTASASEFPIKHPKEVKWSFAGPFGKWDLGQLQRGFKVYKEVCSACHSLGLVSFRNLQGLGFTEAQVKAIAADYEVTDGPDAEGEMYDRPAVASDRFPLVFPNEAAAAAANNGAAPPDFSLLAKARAPERGFPTFVFDIFTLYAENGPDYIYSLLTGYGEDAGEHEVSEGTHYNPYFIASAALAMAMPLEDDLVEYDDGTPGTVENYAKDVSAFMMWAAEPHLVERKAMGFKVLLFLAVFSILLYLTKKQVFASLKD